MSNNKIFDAIVVFDADCDGKLNSRESAYALQSMGVYLTATEEAAWLKSLPIKNGLIKAEELAVAIDNMSKTKSARHKLLELFKVFDREKDGTIKEKELAEVLRTIGELLNESEQQSLLALAALNGKIDYTELVDKLI